MVGLSESGSRSLNDLREVSGARSGDCPVKRII